jgi:hypothetical protein
VVGAPREDRLGEAPGVEPNLLVELLGVEEHLVSRRALGHVIRQLHQEPRPADGLRQRTLQLLPFRVIGTERLRVTVDEVVEQFDELLEMLAALSVVEGARDADAHGRYSHLAVIRRRVAPEVGKGVVVRAVRAATHAL